MNINYISASPLPSQQANAVHVMNMCAAMVTQGHEVTLIGRENNGKKENFYTQYGVENSFKIDLLQSIKMPILWNVDYTRKIVRHIQSKNLTDVFYGRYVYGLFALAKRYPKASIFYEAHAMPMNRAQKLCEKYLFKSKNFVRLITISEALKQDYLKAMPFLQADNILVAHDAAQIPQHKPKIKPFSSPLKACFTGKLSEGKGLGLLIDIANLKPDIEIHIFGGTAKDIKEWKAHANSDNIHFHGYIEHGALQSRVKDMDIMLAPLQNINMVGKNYDIGRWTSPLKIFEYMALQKPLIASDIPVLREIIRDKHNGYLAPPDDAQKWARIIDDIIKTPDKAQKIASQAHQDFLIHYTWEARAKNVLFKKPVIEFGQ